MGDDDGWGDEPGFKSCNHPTYTHLDTLGAGYCPVVSSPIG